MTEDRIGFIGAGLMAEALIGGLIRSELYTPSSMIASDISTSRLDDLSRRYNISVTPRNDDVVKSASTIVLAVKPQHAPDVFRSLSRSFSPDHLLISMMAGVTIDGVRSMSRSDVPIVRLMPNIATLTEAAATAMALGPGTTSHHADKVKEIFSTVGLVVTVEESLMDAVTGLSGSGPAYALAVIESLADGGVAEGLPRHTALQLAAQTLLGAAKLVLDTEEHPAVLRDQVTSPAGTTAEGLAVLEESGIRSAFARAVRAATARARRLGEES